MLNIDTCDLTKAKVDIVVNASNGIGVLGAGVAGAIARAGGPEIQKECKVYCEHLHPRPGHVFLTTAGKMPSYKVLHAVTMRYPGTCYSDNENLGYLIVKNCVNNILKMFLDSAFTSIAIPGLATGIGGLSPKKVAEILVNGIHYYGLDTSKTKHVSIYDIDADFITWCEYYHNNKLKDKVLENAN